MAYQNKYSPHFGHRIDTADNINAANSKAMATISTRKDETLNKPDTASAVKSPKNDNKAQTPITQSFHFLISTIDTC
jgi:hypothetical protein